MSEKIAINFIINMLLIYQVYGKVLPLEFSDIQANSLLEERNLSEEVVHLTDDLHSSIEIEDESDELFETLSVIKEAEIISTDILNKLGHPKLSKFLEVIDEAGVARTFTNRKGYPITVFAPENEAFQSFDEELIDRNHLKSFIFSHVLFGEVYYRDLENDQILQTLDRSSHVIQVKPNFTINGHLILEQILASNGVIYIVSGLPVAPRLNEFTSDNELPQWVREYLPPPLRSNHADSLNIDNSIKPLCNLLEENGLNTAHDLIIRTGLGEMLSENGSLTMFAPTNAAFDAFSQPNGNNMTLKTLLLNHMVDRILTSDEIKDQDIIESLGGANHKVEITSMSSIRRILVSGVEILKFDIMGTNVVVHEVESVIFSLQ